MRKWGENEKDWVEEVGEMQMAAVFHTVYDLVGGAGRLLVSLSLVNVSLGVYLGYSMEVVYRVVHGVVRRVVQGVEVIIIIITLLVHPIKKGLLIPITIKCNINI